MNEQSLKSFLTRLGIQVTRRHQKRGEATKVWLDFCCPAAPYHPKHGYSAERGASAGAVADTTGRASRWSCHSCKTHGTIHDLVRYLQEHQGDPRVNYDALAEEAIDVEFTGMGEIQWGQDLANFTPPPEPLIEEAYEGLWLDAWAVPEARRYLQARHITPETAAVLQLVFDHEKRRIMFPVRDGNGRLFGWTGRTVIEGHKPKVLDYEGLPKRHLILGEHRWRAGVPKIVVEGLFAYARLVQLGVEAFADVGALLGSEMTPEKADILRTWGEPVYLLVDFDEAGDACLYGPIKAVIPAEDEEGEDQVIREEGKGAIHLLKDYVPVFLPAYPEGKVDPDELTLDEVQAMLDKTVRYGLEDFS